MPVLMRGKPFLEPMVFSFKQNDELFHLVLLLSIFLLGFIALIGLHHLFIHLSEQLDSQADNERVRMMLGKSIVHDLTQLEINFYQLVTSANSKGQQFKKIQIKQSINDIKATLNFLKTGGSLTHKLELNLPERDMALQVVHYRPDTQQTFLLEAITLLPQLDNIEQRMKHTEYLLNKRETSQKQQNIAEFFENVKQLKVHIKMTASIFVRSMEITNSLVYAAEENLKQIQKQSKKQKQIYFFLEILLILLVFFAVSASGFVLSRQIYRIHRQLEQTSLQEKMANKSKSVFLANMSHELRTPMNAIIGYSELIEEDLADMPHPTVLNDLHKIKMASKHLLHLINSVLDLSKVEAGKMQVYYEWFDLKNVLNEICEITQPLMRKNHNRFEIHYQAMSEAVYLDLTKFKQILFNLLSNAAKFTENGLIKLTLSDQQEHDGHWLLCAIQDTGIGIAEDKQGELFEVFAQASQSTSRLYGGTGLGLPIARQFAQLMGGNLAVKSQLGQGSVFSLKLPLFQTDRHRAVSANQ